MAESIEMVMPVLLTIGLLIASLDEWQQVMASALLPVLAWYMWRFGVGGRRAAALLAFPLGWIAWLGMSGLWAGPGVHDGWTDEAWAAVQTAAFFVLCVTVVRTAPRTRLEGIAAAFVIAAATKMAADLAGLFADHGISLAPRIDGSGLFDNANRAAALACLMTLFAMHFATGARSTRLRFAASTYVLLAVVYVVFTGSRGGLIVFAGAVFAYAVISGGRSAAIRFLIASVLAAVIAVATVLLVPAAADEVWDRLSQESHRPAIWAETLRLAAERPFLGLGYGYSDRILGTFAHPHNLHLSNLLYGGIPAVCLGLASLGVAAHSAVSVPDRKCRALAVGAVLLVVLWTLPEGSVPISAASEDWYHFWIPVGLAIGLALRSAERSTRTGYDGF